MIVSLNPTYLCNFRCEFCYLTKEQLSDGSKIDLKILEQRLEEINKYEQIEAVDLYGGEIGLLDYTYLLDMNDIIHKYTNDINIITNLYKLNPYFKHPDLTLSVSWDFSARERWDVVLNNMMEIGRPLSVLILASPELIKHSPEKIMSYLYQVPNLLSVEIKPYSRNQANNLYDGELEFEEYVQKWVTMFDRNKILSGRVNLENINRIKNSLSKEYNAFSDSHVYIQPDGTIAVLDFDAENKEYFRPMNNMWEYNMWSEMEKIKIENNEVCGKCEYKGVCLTEHYREVRVDDKSCSGFKGLLDWSKSYFSEKEG